MADEFEKEMEQGGEENLPIPPAAQPLMDLQDLVEMAPKGKKPTKPLKTVEHQTGSEQALTTPLIPETQKGTPMPRATVVEDGKEKRRKRAIDMGISEFLMPPITKRTTAVYEIIGTDKPDPSRTDRGKPEEIDVIMPGTYMFHDTGESDLTKRAKLMRNFGRPNVARDPVTQRQVLEDTILDIEFIAGKKPVNIEKNFREYVFMELHPRNASNKHRDRELEPLFRRTDINTNKTEAFKSALEMLAIDAASAVVNIKDRDTIIGLCVSADLPTGNYDVSTMKSSLRKFAYDNPRKYFGLSKNVLPAIKLNILDGLGLGLLEYKQDKKTFFFAETDDKIFTHAVGEDPVDAMAKAMSNDLQHHYKQLTELLNYWE